MDEADPSLKSGAVIQEPQLRLGPLTIEPSTGRIVRPDGEERAEPKAIDLLLALGEAGGQVVSREELFEKLWPGVTVGEDTLNRAVSKLRRALGDDPKEPRFLETVPKRGYRLLVPLVRQEGQPQAEPKRFSMWRGAAALGAVLLLGVAVLSRQGPEPNLVLEQATDRYMRFTREDNEAAIELYERSLAEDAKSPEAEAGLAAALVQRVVRWPEQIGSDAVGQTSMADALANGLTTSPEARITLDRARDLAERAVRRSGSDADSWRVLGLVRTADGDIDGAFAAYEEALRRDPGNWAVQINLAELHQLKGDEGGSYRLMTEAYADMTSAYLEEPQRIGLWRAPLGVLIAERDREAGRLDAAEAWYRQTLQDEPLHQGATAGLAALLRSQGRGVEADALCQAYEERTAQPLCTNS